MSKRDPLTWDGLPLFASERDIGEAVLGWERRDEFRVMAVVHERRGMPKVSPVWGGRYVPAVKAFFDYEYGLNVPSPPLQIPFASNGVEGNVHERKRPTSRAMPEPPRLGPEADERERARYGYIDKNGNARKSATGVGKVKVTAPDGRSWIEDANETDPHFWHRKLPYKPKRRKESGDASTPAAGTTTDSKP